MTMARLLFGTTSLLMLVAVRSDGFFVDWSISRCVKNCLGNFPCAGRNRHEWEPLYPTLEACCSYALFWDETKKCLMLEMADSPPTHLPIPVPGSSPTTISSSNSDENPTNNACESGFFVDWTNFVCVPNCVAGRTKDDNALYFSLKECCSKALFWKTDCASLIQYPTSQPTARTTILPTPTQRPSNAMVLDAIMDATISSSSPDETFAGASLVVGKNKYVMLRFDLSPLLATNSKILSVQLKLYSRKSSCFGGVFISVEHGKVGQLGQITKG